MSSDKPLWLCRHSDCKDSDYISLYQNLEQTTEVPLGYIHFQVEGTIELHTIIYISKQAIKRPKLELYSEGNLIIEDYQGLIPEFLNFVGGVVEIEENLFNMDPITRMRIEKLIKKFITKKVLVKLQEIVDEISFPLEYFGNLKLHFLNNEVDAPKIFPLLRFETFKTRKSLISFDQYVKEMDKNQTEVFFFLFDDLKSKNFELEETKVEVLIFQEEDLENIPKYETYLNLKLKPIQ
jgi:HSP90 family molecular chaperone